MLHTFLKLLSSCNRILGTFRFFFPGVLAARFKLQTHSHIATICLLNISNNSLYNASYYMCRKITSHWLPLFSKKMVAAASFSYKIGSGGLIFQQNWRRRQGFGNITGGCSDMVWILGGFARSADRAAQFEDPHIAQLICRSRNHR